MYFLSEAQLERFKKALLTAIAIPFIDDIEDFIVEAIWEYAKNINGPDPFFNVRSKRLYDVVDPSTHVGWSVKSLQWPFYPGCEFELVIQRADVYKKAQALGFDHLDGNSDPNLIGKALMRHWANKVNEDAACQSVRSKRIVVLLKTENKKKFAIYEDDIVIHKEDDLRWEWANATKSGLKGMDSNGFCVYRWYSSQKQLFERFSLPQMVQQFAIVPHRLTKECIVELVSPCIPRRQ